MAETWREDEDGSAVHDGELKFQGEGGTFKELLSDFIKPAVKKMVRWQVIYQIETEDSHRGNVQWREDLMKVTLKFDGVSQELLYILHKAFHHALGKLSTDLKTVKSFTTNRPDLYTMTSNCIDFNSHQGIFVDRPLGSRGDKNVTANSSWDLPLDSLDPIQEMDLWTEPKPQKSWNVDWNWESDPAPAEDAAAPAPAEDEICPVCNKNKVDPNFKMQSKKM
jgi:hypothetical protein